MRKAVLFIAMSLDGYIADENPAELLRRLKEKPGKDIWICGGANLITQLMKEKLIDRYYITVIPTLLGKGIRLFEELESEQKLSLVKTQHYNGMVDLVYEIREIRRKGRK